jgi:hypothetical protein
MTEPRFTCECGVSISIRHRKLHSCASQMAQRTKRALPRRTCDWAPCRATYQPILPQQKYCCTEHRYSARNATTARTPEQIEEKAMQPLRDETAAMEREAAAVYSRLIVGPPSHRLWWELLGVSL